MRFEKLELTSKLELASTATTSTPLSLNKKKRTSPDLSSSQDASSGGTPRAAPRSGSPDYTVTASSALIPRPRKRAARRSGSPDYTVNASSALIPRPVTSARRTPRAATRSGSPDSSSFRPPKRQKVDSSKKRRANEDDEDSDSETIERRRLRFPSTPLAMVTSGRTALETELLERALRAEDQAQKARDKQDWGWQQSEIRGAYLLERQSQHHR